MEKTIPATEANRRFSALLRGVRTGHSYVITSHGQPVAKMVPAQNPDDAAERRRRERAKRALLAHLRAQPILNLPRISRDEMHER